MNVSDPLQSLRTAWRLACEIVRLPRAQLKFDSALNPELVRTTYACFTKRHPRYPLFRNKSLGIALIKLSEFKTSAEYLQTIQAKDLGAHHSKKALSRGYVFREINRNDYIEDIYAINTSLEQRQGRPMDPAYFQKQLQYEDVESFRYYGVLAADGRLMAYCDVGIYGNFAATDRILGYHSNDGIMYLLLFEIACRLIDEGHLHYLMYDTFLGAQPGLRNFKRKLGFRPYRIRYAIR
jgi:hypothetical protein